MRSISELEQVVEGVNLDAAGSAYSTLESLAGGGLSVQEAYQQILEMVVYDILKTPKK